MAKRFTFVCKKCGREMSSQKRPKRLECQSSWTCKQSRKGSKTAVDARRARRVIMAAA